MSMGLRVSVGRVVGGGGGKVDRGGDTGGGRGGAELKRRRKSAPRRLTSFPGDEGVGLGWVGLVQVDRGGDRWWKDGVELKRRRRSGAPTAADELPPSVFPIVPTSLRVMPPIPLPPAAIKDFDYGFAENGLTAYKLGQELASQSFINHIGEDEYKRFVKFVLHYIADLDDVPVKRGTFVEFRRGMVNISPIGRNAT